ncbi:MAG: hypothetical protein IJZ68_08445 [Bacteroidaceae bacterium]|nr:hypothetical protein [Bacteroidaceae bacterium]
MIIAPLLIKAHEGEDLTYKELGTVNQVLDQYNLSMEEAIALNIWTDTPKPIQDYIRYGDNHRYCKEELALLAEKLRARYCSESDIQYIVNHVRNIKYAYRELKECYQNALPLCTDSTKTPILSTVKNLHTAVNVPEIIAHIYKAMHDNPLKENITVYRAIQGQFVGPSIMNEGFVSTSLTKESSFAKYTGYNTLFELHLPTGFHCINVTPFSNYDTEENEILLPPNVFVITERFTNGYSVYIKANVAEIEEFA